MARKDPDKYIGRWTETPFEAISLPLEPASLSSLVVGTSDGSTRFTHQQISHWCAQFWLAHESAKFVPDGFLKFVEIAEDIDAQWDLYLVGTYSLEELQCLEFASVKLPIEWFQEWAIQLQS